MPTFVYRAKDSHGFDRKGQVETSDVRQVARLLSQKGLVLIEVKEKKESKKNLIDKYLNKVSFNELVATTRQLATMIDSGLVLSEAIDILEEQQQNKTFKQVLGEISRDIKGGLDLATALSKHPDVFPPLYSNLVRAGEQAGKLDVVLQQMATNLEKDREFRSRIRGAMIYPVVVVIMMILVITIMMIFVIPRLTSLYDQSTIELPLPTKMLIATSSVFQNYWWLLLAITIGSVIAFRRWVATSSGKYAFDSFLLKIPVVKKIIEGTSLTNFTRTFGLLITAGVPILDALHVVAGVIGNAVYQKALEDSFRGVERGLLLSNQLESTHVFPRILTQMFKVGEETGKVDQLSFKLSDYFEQETDHLVKNLTVIIEPVILVILGAGVGFLVLSIVLPIYQLTTSFN